MAIKPLPSSSGASPDRGHTQSLSPPSGHWPVVAPTAHSTHQNQQSAALASPCQQHKGTKAASLCHPLKPRRTDESSSNAVCSPVTFPRSHGVLYQHPGGQGKGLGSPIFLGPNPSFLPSLSEIKTLCHPLHLPLDFAQLPALPLFPWVSLAHLCLFSPRPPPSRP